MKSRWEHLRPRAESMRRHGAAIRDIETRLGIPRSTLSGWLSSVRLSIFHEELLKKRADKALITARKAAVKWHNGEREKRLAFAAQDALASLENINVNQKEILELALAMLYLGEGSKTNAHTCMGNSNPRILKFFVTSLCTLYNVPIKDFRCHLHLRADQDPEILKKYWAKTLGIPKRNFGKALIDYRTAGKATYSHYKGVCAIDCGRVAIQRKLMYIADIFCDKIQDTLRG